MKSYTIQAFETSLEQALDAISNQSEGLRTCVEPILNGVERNFQQSQSARGDSWPARKDQGDGHPLLIDTGDLMTSAIGAGTVVQVGATEMSIDLPPGQSGTSRAGVRRHEFGDQEIMGQDGILARPYFGVSEETADECTKRIADNVMDQLAAIG